MHEDNIACFPIWFAKVRKALQRRQMGILKPYGLSSMHAMYLVILSHDENGMTFRELNEKLFVDKANTSRAITTLEKKGYVRKENLGNSVLKARILLTDAGKSIAQLVAKDMKSTRDKLIGTLSKEEIKSVREVMYKISKAADDI